MRIPLIIFILLAAILALYLSLGGGGDVAAHSDLGLEISEPEGPGDDSHQSLIELEKGGALRRDGIQSKREGLRELQALELVLGADRSKVRIAVVDTEGEPMPYYPVHICIRKGEERFELVAKARAFRLVSNKVGIAELPLSVLWAHTTATEPLFATSGFIWRTEIFTPIGGAHLRGEPLTLQVRRGGTLQVELLEENGERMEEEARLYADLGGNQRPSVRAKDGTFWFHELPVGKRLKIRAKGNGRFDEEDWEAGPLANSEPRRFLQFTVGGALPVVTGRLRDGKGNPLKHHSVLVRHRGERPWAAKTDDVGVFTLSVPLIGDAVLAISSGQNDEWQDDDSMVQVTGLRRGDSRDLGVITWERKPNIVTGRFQSGEAGGFDGSVYLEGQNAEGEWEFYRSATVGSSGAFRFVGEAKYGRMRLQYTKRQDGFITGNTFLLDQPIYFTAGSEDLIIWLRSSAYVATRVVDYKDRELVVRFDYLDGRTHALAAKDGWVKGAVPYGHADLHVVDVASDENVHTISEVSFDKANPLGAALLEIWITDPETNAENKRAGANGDFDNLDWERILNAPK